MTDKAELYVHGVEHKNQKVKTIRITLKKLLKLINNLEINKGKWKHYCWHVNAWDAQQDINNCHKWDMILNNYKRNVARR